MNRRTFLSVVGTVCSVAAWAATTPARSDEVQAVLARARKLADAEEFPEATAVLAKAFTQHRDSRLLAEWLLTDQQRIENLTALQSHKAMPRLPATHTSEGQALAPDIVWKAATPHWEDIWMSFLGPTRRLVKEYDKSLKDIRVTLDAEKPPIMAERAVADRIRAFEECGRSSHTVLAAISTVLQSATQEEIDIFLPFKQQAQKQIERLRQARADFVSYDHIAPRVISAHISLIPDAVGVTGLPYVTDASLKSAAESLGESGRDLEFAHKDAKRFWLDAMSKLKQAAGKEQFKDLETLATVVSNPKLTPDQWEPR